MKDRKTDVAEAKFTSGFNCAQSVLFAFCKDLQLDEDTSLKMATGFGAGMGRKEEVCGAVTGGILVLGARYGRGCSGDRSDTEATYTRTRTLMERFAERHGSCICRTLLGGCELTTEAGQQQFKDEQLLNRVCIPCVRSAVEILEEIIG